MRWFVFPLILLASACSDTSVTKFNSDPEVAITSHSDGDTVQEGVPENLRGQVGDPNHSIDSLSVTWLLSGTEVCTESEPDDEGVVTCEAIFTPGDGEVALEVRDPEGASASTRLNVDVQPTDAPLAVIIEPSSDGVYYSDVLTTLSGTVSDNEDAIGSLVVTWESGIDGVLVGAFDTPDSEGGLLGAANLSEGEHFLTLTVTDTTAKAARDSVTINVGPPNTAPTCEITNPADSAAGPEGEEVRFEGTAADVDVPSDWLAVTWTSDKQGDLGVSTPDTGGGIGFAISDLSVDTHRITMTVNDEVGATCTDSIYYTVGTPPSLTVTAPTDGDTLNHSEAVVFEATVNDNEDLPNEVALSWNSDVDGVFSEAGADSSGAVTVSVSSLSPGDHVVTVTATDTDGLFVTDTVSFNLNEPPTAPTVTLEPDPAVTNQMLVATASGSEDPEGTGTVTYNYEWFEDGVASTESSSATYPSSATAKHHTYRVQVVASDGLVGSSYGWAEVSVINSDPVLVGLTVSPSTAAAGDTLTCSATATDIDPEDSPTVDYVWSDGSTGSTYTVTMADPVDSIMTCTATANDGDGGTATGTASATVTNTAPIVDMVAVTPLEGQVGDVLTCTATASDPDGETPTITYAWSDGSVGSTYTIADTDDPGDTIICTATATDTTGASATGTAAAVVANTNPSITGVSVVPASAKVGTMLVCSASATDADGETPELSYAWSTGSIGPTYVVAESDNPGTTLTCTVTATDDDGGSDSASATALVENTDPTIVSINVTPSSARIGESLTCAVIATDADGGTPTITYAWSDGALGASRIVSASTSPGDTLTCTATADDGDGGVVSASASAIVENTDPTLGTVSITPATGKVGDVLTCAATATDADGGSPIISYAWSTGTEGSVHAITSDDDPGDTLTCTATATDEHDGTATDSATATVENTAPVMDTVTISPEDPTSDDTLICTATASDPDGDSPGISYIWTNASTASLLGTDASLTLSTATSSPDDIITCTAAATDDDGVTGSASASVTVGNTNPEVSSVSISPSTGVDTSTTLTCSASASDDDGGTPTITYAWTNDTEGTSLGAGASLMLSTSTSSPDDSITCTATATDDDGGTGTDSASVSLDNTAPKITSVTLSPLTVYTDDTITASVSTSDDDGDSVTVTYAWYVEGILVGATGSTLSGASYFDKHDGVYVVVTPTDGTDEGETFTSDALTVGNSAPDAPGVSITETLFEICDEVAVLLLDGVDDLVQIDGGHHDGDPSSLHFTKTDDFSLEIWFKLVSVEGRDVLFQRGDISGARISLHIEDGTFVGEVYSSGTVGTTVHSSPGTVVPGEWYHVAMARDVGHELSLYINGEEVDTASDTASDLSWSGLRRFALGRQQSGGYHANIYLSEARVWQTARSLEEISANWREALTGTESGLAALWSFTESSGDSEPDLTGNGADGSLYGGPTWITVDDMCRIETDGLVCETSPPSTDADGDSVTYTFGWEVDGDPFTDTETTAETGDAVSGDSLGYDEIWTCTVTPNDGESDGASVDASVVIEATLGLEYVGAHGGTMIKVDAQTFEMGCTAGMSSCVADESPAHDVTLTNDFYIGETEVTQAEYETMMGTNPSYFSSCGSDCPVEYVSWHMSAAFANAVSDSEGLEQCYTCTGSGSSTSCTIAVEPYSCGGYRLPTEAEWEAAARCGEDTLYAGSTVIGDVAWYGSNSGTTTHAVATKASNACGLYDMSANVWEWSQDWYSSSYYSSSPGTDPGGPISGDLRVIRGGAWNSTPAVARVANRNWFNPTSPNGTIGLRLLRTSP